MISRVEQLQLTGIPGVVHVVEVDVGVEVDSSVGGVSSGPGGDGGGEGQDCDEDLHFVGDVSAAIDNRRLLCPTLNDRHCV